MKTKPRKDQDYRSQTETFSGDSHRSPSSGPNASDHQEKLRSAIVPGPKCRPGNFIRAGCPYRTPAENLPIPPIRYIVPGRKSDRPSTSGWPAASPPIIVPGRKPSLAATPYFDGNQTRTLTEPIP